MTRTRPTLREMIEENTRYSHYTRKITAKLLTRIRSDERKILRLADDLFKLRLRVDALEQKVDQL